MKRLLALLLLAASLLAARPAPHPIPLADLGWCGGPCPNHAVRA